jgi:hypothetical protein
MKKWLYATLLILGLISLGILIGTTYERERMKWFVPLDTCNDVVCQGANEEIKHWLGRFDIQQMHLLECLAVNHTYEKIFEANPQCYNNRPLEKINE